MKKKDLPATKGDLAEFKAHFDEKFVTKDEFSTVKGDVSTLKGDVSTLKGDVSTLKGDISRIDAKTDRIAVELVKTQSELHEIKDDMATKGHIEQLMRRFDDFAARAVHYDRADAIRGQSLIKVEVMAEDHERRIRTLESGRPPNP